MLDLDRPILTLDADVTAKLRRWNLAAAGLHFVTGLVIVLIGDRDFGLPVTSFNINGPPGTDLANGVFNEVFSFPLALGVAAFSFLSALFHLIVVVDDQRYHHELERGRNRFRWVEYSLSSTLMIVLIAMVTGITDIAALIAIAFVNAAMILFGWIMEMVSRPGPDAWWTPFWFGCVAGIGPWTAIVVSIIANVSVDGGEGPPAFVYGIIVTIFVFFNCFAVTQWLQYRRIGKWADYVHGEKTYIVLSFVAKSALAWQIFGNTLIPEA